MNPKPMPSIPWRQIDRNVVIIEPTRGEVHELNETAAFLWRQMNGDRKPDELARLLGEEFGISESEAITDVLDFVREGQELGIIVES